MLKEKKGFTLIELLAVIVVLAIVAVLGISQVLPMLADARKEAFATEANYALDAAQSLLAEIELGKVTCTTSDNTTTCAGGEKTEYTGYYVYCFELKDLYDAGAYNKKELANGANSKYQGTVSVKVPKSNTLQKYDYTIRMYNDTYYVNKNGSVEKADVVDKTDSSTIACNNFAS